MALPNGISFFANSAKSFSPANTLTNPHGGKAGDGYRLYEMPPDAAEEDPLVFLRTTLLSVSCNMSGTRYDERKNPDEKVGGRQSFCRKDGKTGG